MLKAVYFVEETEASAALFGPAVASEMKRAVRALREAGFDSGILFSRKGPAGKRLPPPEESGGILFLCADPELARALRREGRFAAGYAHAENAGENFSGVPYILQEPDLVDRDSYCKIYEREAGLPWTILETERCLVREFIEEDFDGISALYDEEARRYLEPPSADREHELAILRAYIRRIYGLYGFGHWAVLDRSGDPASAASGRAAPDRGDDAPAASASEEQPAVSVPGRLIGRVGFAVLTARQEQEALELGIRAEDGQGSGIDADFGFLIAAPYRGRGIAEEVCRALLRYGFTELGFSRIRAEARADNAASIRLLKKNGFVPVGTVSGDGTAAADESTAADRTAAGNGTTTGNGSGAGDGNISGDGNRAGNGNRIGDGSTARDGSGPERIVFLCEKGRG